MFGFLLLFNSNQIFAACSPFVGGATLNEILKEQGNGDAFIEIELLDSSISSTTYNQWTLKFCHDEGNNQNQSSQCNSISVADMNDATQWIWAEEPIIDKGFIDFDAGFDLSLLDENHLFIDYIQVDNYSGQDFTCSYPELEYVFPIPNDITNGTKILLRKPSGTGEWLESKNLNTYPPTPGEGNDGDPIIDHFEIIHDGQGLTCEAETITIKACADASCTTLNHDATDVQLSINGTVNKTVTVVGSTDTSFAFTTAGTATLSLDQTYECENGASDSCVVVFDDTGFIFGNDSNSLPIIPTQLSGKPSNTGFNSEEFFLQAVKTDDNTGSCVGLFPDGTDVPVNLSYTCHEDSSACTRNITLTNNVTEINLMTSAVEHNLRFSSDSKAYFSLNYPDAGKLIVNAQKDIDVDGLGDIKSFSVTSNAFVVRPFGFQLDFSQDANSADALASTALGSDFKKAGETFSLRAIAKQWANNQDDDNDGIPDNFTDLNSNAIAGNFDGEQLTVTSELFLPDPLTANSGVLTAETSYSFSASILDDDYNFSEVGIIHLSALLTDSDYIGGGNIQGYIANVGRFTPAYFIQTVDVDVDLGVDGNGSLNAKHSLLGTCTIKDWAYSGQETNSVGTITYGLPPEILITAYNTDNIITKNYTESGFMKLSASGIVITPPTEDFEKDRIDPMVVDEKVKINSVMTPSLDLTVEEAGVLNYEFNSADHFIYEHNTHSKYAPFPAKIPFAITQVQDSDLINLYSGSDPDIIPTEQVLTEGIEIRFGRWTIDNAFGPETSLLPMPMTVQYWNGIEFEINTDDNCTVPNIDDEINSGEIWEGDLTDWQYRLLDTSTETNEPITPEDTLATVPDPLTTFSDGIYRDFIFTSPGNGNRGSLNLEYEVPVWLKYDWQNNGNFEDNPSAKATFGLFRGNDRIIYQREVNN